MARWLLKTAHYLPVPGTEIEFKETNRDTGRQAKKTFAVPLYLNPEDPNDWNTPEGIIVAQGRITGRDIEFTGPPTPDMEPLDDEAAAITEKHRHLWVHPIDSLEGDYASQIWRQLEAKIVEGGGKQATSLKGVDSGTLDKLQEQMEQLAQQNALLTQRLEQLSEKKDRRV
jgi:hypothetical protein